MITPLLFAIALAGDWTGTSTCTNLKLLPACHDELVVYHFTPLGGDRVHVEMDKIVDGKPENMGGFDMTRRGAGLSYEMTDRQGRHAVWEFYVKGNRIDGTLSMLPGREVVRRVAVKKR